MCRASIYIPNNIYTILLGILFKLAFEIDAVMYFIVVYICYMEFNSIAENCDKLGFEVPILKDKLNNREN